MLKKLLLIGLIFCIRDGIAQSEFTIELSLPPLKLEFNELLRIIEDSNHLVSKYDSTYFRREENLVIQNDNIRQTTTNISDSKNIRFTEARSVNYQYINQAGTIKKVELDLNDHERKISITGSNYVEIQTFSDAYKRELLKFRNYFGGTTFRSSLMSIPLLLFVLIILLFLVRLIKGIELDNRKSKLKILWPIIFFPILLSLVFFFSESKLSENIFPGFVIYNNSPNFINQYSNYFTFWGFIIALVSFILFDIIKFKQRN